MVNQWLKKILKVFFCNKKHFISKFKYNSPPVGEIDFKST